VEEIELAHAHADEEAEHVGEVADVGPVDADVDVDDDAAVVQGAAQALHLLVEGAAGADEGRRGSWRWGRGSRR
jgi:hypothetical protein